VFAVPKSMPISRERRPSNQFRGLKAKVRNPPMGPSEHYTIWELFDCIGYKISYVKSKSEIPSSML